MAIPRLLAIAELGWSKPEQKDWNAFKQRLSDQFERLNIMGINYRIPDLEGFNAVNAFIGEGTINVTCLTPLRKFTIPLMAVLLLYNLPYMKVPSK